MQIQHFSHGKSFDQLTCLAVLARLHRHARLVTFDIDIINIYIDI